MNITNKVNWAIDPNRCALLIHDMQTHYLAALPAVTRNALIANAGRVAQTCMARDVSIFASQVPPAQQSRERGLMLDMWGMGSASRGEALDPELGLDTDVIRRLTKRSYSVFYGNDFEVMLRRLGRHSIIIVGVYEAMDAAYDAKIIDQQSKALGHAPLIDRNFRSQHEAKTECAEEIARMKLVGVPDRDDKLFDFRTMAERVNARLKDEFGARFVRVRGAIKVKCHLMFGVLVLAVDQIQILCVSAFRAAPTPAPDPAAEKSRDLGIMQGALLYGHAAPNVATARN